MASSMAVLRRISGKATARSLIPSYFGGVCGLSRVGACRFMSSNVVLDPSPWLMLPPSFQGNKMIYNFYSLAKNEVVSLDKRGIGGEDEKVSNIPSDESEFIGSSHGWLILFNRSNSDLFLSNPITRRHVKLPPIQTLPDPDYNLRFRYGCVNRVVISSSPDVDTCRVMMSYGPEYRLAFCCLGDDKWTPIGDWYSEYGNSPGIKIPRVYHSFVYSTTLKLFFCLTQYLDIEVWDLSDPKNPGMVADGTLTPTNKDDDDVDGDYKGVTCGKALVAGTTSDEDDDLFLVGRDVMEQMGPDGSSVENWPTDHPHKTVSFWVHKFDLEKGVTRKMDNGCLGGLSLFVDRNDSFALRAREFPGLKPNSIYSLTKYQLSRKRTLVGTILASSITKTGLSRPAIIRVM